MAYKYQIGDHVLTKDGGGCKVIDIVEDWVITDFCIETYPCKHLVIVDGKMVYIAGIEICQYYIDNGIPIHLHFREYENYDNDDNDGFDSV
jgi:hypothetical protein